MKLVRLIDTSLEKATSAILVASVFGMLLFSLLGIVLRWFETSLLWIDPLTRHLVFLSTFLGGVIATGRGNHIAIDILGKYLESTGNKLLENNVKRFVYIATSVILIWAVNSSIDFLKVELEYGREVFWGIESGYLVAIIPVGLGLIAIRFILTLILSFETKGAQS